MTTILLCIDTDVAKAKEQATSLAEIPLDREETRVVLLHVFRGSDEGADAANLKSVEAAATHLTDAGFDVEVSQASGDAVRRILEKAEEIDADILSLVGRKRSPAGKALFGSVSQDVILESERTVLLETVSQ